MRFTSATLFFLLGLAVALPANTGGSSNKDALVKGINDNLKAGDKEISATQKAQDAAKKNDAAGLKKNEQGINGALDEAIKDREKNQKIAGNKDPALTAGLGKVENAQKGAKATVSQLTGNPKQDEGGLQQLDATFKKGKTTNTQNLEEAKKNFH
ncbi:hypothetical protein LZ30DRAFT_827076 [Colletotrichum cereale]|nr:hypothetical protein LZ30DRAFT_827076 [Colletotrichum cereale]